MEFIKKSEEFLSSLLSLFLSADSSSRMLTPHSRAGPISWDQHTPPLPRSFPPLPLTSQSINPGRVGVRKSQNESNHLISSDATSAYCISAQTPRCHRSDTHTHRDMQKPVQDYGEPPFWFGRVQRQEGFSVCQRFRLIWCKQKQMFTFSHAEQP